MTSYKNFLLLVLDPGGVSESMDGQGCVILVFELIPRNLIFARENPFQKFTLQDFVN